MELEEMKQIWCAQNEDPWYVFDEEALHQNIKSKKKKAARGNNFSDFGLIAICIIVAIFDIFYIITGTPNIFNYLVIATLLFDIGYIWMKRLRRKKREQTLDRTMLGDLDHAISSVTYAGKRLKTMLWWNGLPLITLSFLMGSEASLWNWVVSASALILSALVLWLGYNRLYKPKKQKLEALREKLTEKTEAELL